MLSFKPFLCSPLSLSSKTSLVALCFLPKGDINCISEAIAISPSNSDSSLCFISQAFHMIYSDIYHMIYLLFHLTFCLFRSTLFFFLNSLVKDLWSLSFQKECVLVSSIFFSFWSLFYLFILWLLLFPSLLPFSFILF